jgi:hypothetical protein
VRASKSQTLWASTGCYGDCFTFLYVDDVRTSQETRLWPSMTSYRDSFTFFMSMIFVPYWKFLWASTACYWDCFTSLYVDDVRTSEETHLWASTARYRDSFTSLYVVDVRTSEKTHLWASTACYWNSFTFYM